MNTKRFVSLGAAAATIIATSLTQAGDDPAQAERAAVATMSTANVVAEQEGRYHQARQLAVEGNASLSARTNAWLGLMQSWIQGWTRTMAFADLNTDIPYDVFQENLANMLSAQARTVVQLQDDAAGITALATDAVAVMGKPETIPAGATATAYTDVITALGTRQTELRSMIASVSAIPQQKLARIAAIDDASRKAVTAHMKAALLARAKYPLVKALADLNALLAAEKTVEPALIRLESAFTKMNVYNASLAYFHADQAAVPARKDCSDVKAALASMVEPAKYVAGAKVKVGKYCDGIEALYQNLAGDPSITKADYVGAYLDGEKTQLAATCKNPKSGPACEKLALIAALPAADLAKMSDAQLRFVELGWSAAMDRAVGK